MKESKKVINPKGERPLYNCKYCHMYWEKQKIDWTGLPVKNILLQCSFCRDGGQDW